MSALPTQADINLLIENVRWVPQADIRTSGSFARTRSSAGEANWVTLVLNFEIHPKRARGMHTMAENWSADVKKYVADANEKAIAGIVKYCGIALQKRDSSLVSFTDKEEVARVRNNFLKKKLGLTNSDAELDKAIMLAADKMKGDRTKNRVTVYYLLADHFGKLSMFG